MSEDDDQHDDFLPLSLILGRPVRGPHGEVLGKLRDVIARVGTAEHPPLTGLVLRAGNRDHFVPWSHVGRVEKGGVYLSTAAIDLRPFQRREGEMLLGRDLLDRKVIDVASRRVVRVHEVLLREEAGACRLAAVATDVFALARRLGVEGLLRKWHRGGAAEPLDWSHVEVFASEIPVRLPVSHARTADMHPVEIAEVVESVSLKQGHEILGALDDETAAEALEEVSPERQADLVEGMDDERAADILEKMDPDDAADLLADLPDDRAGEILECMAPSESEEVRELLQYPENSAGGIMTTDLVAVPRSFTAGEVLEDLRSRAELPEMVHYVYVVASRTDPRLVGVLSLRDLLVAPPERPVGDLMCTDFVSVPVTESDREVARTMARYDLLALPVVDEGGRLRGIVTVDDAMEIILPGEWKKRLPRVFR
ncbi:MAG: CBS domain-containing protein [Armatimonadota bacterium]|nr:CBS domain-containing protein [Armatimonadota bacterium]